MSAGNRSTGLVVVTGVSRFLGARVAARLVDDPRVAHVIGLDSQPPPRRLAARLRGVDLVRADLTRSSTVLADLDPQVVVHLGLITAPGPATGGRAGMKEHNVIGTMQLLASCQRAATLRKLVVRSSTAAYGASFRDPAVFTEQTEAREVPRGGFARDILDVESYVRAFCRHRPEVVTTVLRLAPLIGPDADTTLTRHLSRPLVPTVLGRDARLQFAHVDDVLEVTHRAVVEDHPGTYNVAGPGVITLHQAVGRLGRIPLPVAEPALSAVAALARLAGRPGFGRDQVDLFVHGRVVDATRLVEEFGVTLRSTPDAFEEFARRRRDGAPLDPARWAGAERWLRDGLRRRWRGGGTGAAA